MSKDAHRVDGQPVEDDGHRTDGPEPAEGTSSGGVVRKAVAKATSASAATKLAAAAGIAAVAAGGAVAAGDELLGEADERAAGELGDQAAETLVTGAPMLDSLRDLLPDPPRPESSTDDSTAGRTDRPRFEGVERPVAPAPVSTEGGGSAPLRRLAVGVVAVVGVGPDEGHSAPRRTEGRSSPRGEAPERVESPSGEPSPEKADVPKAEAPATPGTSGPEEPKAGDPMPDVGAGMEAPDATTTSPGTTAPEAGAGASPDAQSPEVAPPGATPPVSPSPAPAPGAQAP